jgi:cytochrome P450
VVLLYGAANRDPQRWDRADQFDITREPKPHLALGNGIHHCIGAPLARLKARIVLEEVLRQMPGYELAGTPTRLPSRAVRGFASLPVASPVRNATAIP